MHKIYLFVYFMCYYYNEKDIFVQSVLVRCSADLYYTRKFFYLKLSEFCKFRARSLIRFELRLRTLNLYNLPIFRFSNQSL